MTVRQRLVAVLVAGGLALAGAPAAGAGAPSDHLKAQIDRVLQVLADPALKADGKIAERRQRVRQVANDTFDFRETAQRSLGPHWLKRSPAEREEFVGLFADLLERAYFGRIEQYEGESITYLGDAVDGDRATVRTRIVTKQGTDIPVDYRMLEEGGRWLVYDVLIEGVSLIANYRAQFDRIIRTQSYQELINRMKTKIDEFDKDVPKPKKGSERRAG